MHFNKTQSSLRGEGIEIQSSQESKFKTLLITSEIGEANTWELSLLFKCVELNVEVETINENSSYFYLQVDCRTTQLYCLNFLSTSFY